MSFAVFESMNHNWSPSFHSMSSPMFTSAPAEDVAVPQQQSLNLSGNLPVENQNSSSPAPVESEKELDFFAELLMDFSKGIYSAALTQDSASGKRKQGETEFGSLKKTKRIPRSPSINALVGEQTIACEEHSSKHVRCPLNCPNRRPGSKRVRTVLGDESRTPSFVVEKEELIQTFEVLFSANFLNFHRLSPKLPLNLFNLHSNL
jgi:hypothetical protein